MINNLQFVTDFIKDYFELNNEQIHEKLDFKSLESWDSLKYMNFVMEIETKFNLNLSRDELVNITTFLGLTGVLQVRGLLGG